MQMNAYMTHWQTDANALF